MKLKKYQYFIMSLDPVHIGTGGYSLGRVDNAIVREPSNNLPKIPGTSLHGAIRTAAAHYYGSPESAGQKPTSQKPNGETVNPIIYTFGSGQEGGFRAGIVSISDAQIVLFPIATQNGPIWITTEEILKENNIRVPEKGNNDQNNNENCSKENNKIKGGETENNLLNGYLKKASVTSEIVLENNLLPLGWLMMEVDNKRIKLSLENDTKQPENEILEEVFNRTAIIDKTIFSEIVNSSLEVRTSVAINPETGAAEKGALFTYEAIPRTTFLSFNVIVDDYRAEENCWPVTKNSKKINLEKKWTNPNDVIETGCQLLEYLGVGGMTTRGFGRIKVVKIIEGV